MKPGTIEEYRRLASGPNYFHEQKAARTKRIIQGLGLAIFLEIIVSLFAWWLIDITINKHSGVIGAGLVALFALTRLHLNGLSYRILNTAKRINTIDIESANLPPAIENIIKYDYDTISSDENTMNTISQLFTIAVLGYCVLTLFRLS